MTVLIWIRVAGFHDPDLVIGKAHVAAGQIDFRHVATRHRSSTSRPAGTSHPPGRRRMVERKSSGQGHTLWVVRADSRTTSWCGLWQAKQLMRGSFPVEALAVGQAVRLKTHVNLAEIFEVLPHHRLPGAMALTAKVVTYPWTTASQLGGAESEHVLAGRPPGGRSCLHDSARKSLPAPWI